MEIFSNGNVASRFHLKTNYGRSLEIMIMDKCYLLKLINYTMIFSKINKYCHVIIISLRIIYVLLFLSIYVYFMHIMRVLTEYICREEEVISK